MKNSDNIEVSGKVIECFKGGKFLVKLDSGQDIMAYLSGRMKKFRILADRFRYPRTRHTVKFSIIAGITNLLAGF
mgnify:CR=1 FL=1